MRTIFSARRSDFFFAASIALLAVCVIRAAIFGFHWPLIHDAVTMPYIGAMLLEGVLPYRDIFYMNFPLTYWIHAVGIAILGKSDIATRIYDLIWCADGAFAIALVLWSRSRAIALAAALVYVMAHF